MVSLTIAPLLKDSDGAKYGNTDWENWYYGSIPFFLFLVVTIGLVWKGILTWKDPLGDTSRGAAGEAKSSDEKETCSSTTVQDPQACSLLTTPAEPMDAEQLDKE